LLSSLETTPNNYSYDQSVYLKKALIYFPEQVGQQLDHILNNSKYILTTSGQRSYVCLGPGVH